MDYLPCSSNNQDKESIHYWIQHLDLTQHPEGGYFRRILTSDKEITIDNGEDTNNINNNNRNSNNNGTDIERKVIKRPQYTSINFLLTIDSPSKFHSLSSDEIWCYHFGYPITIHIISPIDSSYQSVILGPSPDKGHKLQTVVPAGYIFASSVNGGEESREGMEEKKKHELASSKDRESIFTVVGCIMSPGFDFQDFKIDLYDDLIQRYPHHTEIIERMAYKSIPSHIPHREYYGRDKKEHSYLINAS